MKHEFFERLRKSGWRENEDGSWSKPGAVARLRPTEPERDPQRTVAGAVRNESEGAGSVVRCSVARRRRNQLPVVAVTLVAFVRRLRDDDNLIGGLKVLRDAVAFSLGVDDADPRVLWQCRQIETRGRVGTLVRIEAHGLTEAQAKAVQGLIGSDGLHGTVTATKIYTASDAWHTERHTLVGGEKLAELEHALKIERVSVSVAKGGAA